jgi:hypothetical protein
VRTNKALSLGLPEDASELNLELFIFHRYLEMNSCIIFLENAKLISLNHICNK